MPDALDAIERELFQVTWTATAGDRIVQLLDESMAVWCGSQVQVAKPELRLELEPRKKLAEALNEFFTWQLASGQVLSLAGQDGSRWSVHTQQIISVRLVDPQSAGERIIERQIGFAPPPS